MVGEDRDVGPRQSHQCPEHDAVVDSLVRIHHIGSEERGVSHDGESQVVIIGKRAHRVETRDAGQDQQRSGPRFLREEGRLPQRVGRDIQARHVCGRMAGLRCRLVHCLGDGRDAVTPRGPGLIGESVIVFDDVESGGCDGSSHGRQRLRAGPHRLHRGTDQGAIGCAEAGSKSRNSETGATEIIEDRVG